MGDVPPSPRCERNCSCICHLRRPGMKLVWVPVEYGEEHDEQVEAEVRTKKKEVGGGDEQGGEGESEAGDQDNTGHEEDEDGEGLTVEDVEDDEEPELYLSNSSDESGSESGGGGGGGELMGKAKFQHTLELVGEQLRRRSDPGPQVVLTSYTTHSLSPGSFKAHSMDTETDSDIYEMNIVVEGVTPPRPSEPQVPLIRVKPPRRSRSKLSSSASDDGSELRGGGDDPPPAVPPRVPMLPDKPSKRPSLVPVLGGIPLPQPTPEERRGLRPASPLPPPASASPPASPRLHHRVPPPPPSKLGQNGLRGSSQSLNSLPPTTGQFVMSTSYLICIEK